MRYCAQKPMLKHPTREKMLRGEWSQGLKLNFSSIKNYDSIHTNYFRQISLKLR